MSRRLTGAAAVLAAVAGAAVAASLLARTWPLGRLPMWDAAGNGWGGAQLLAALGEGRWLDFLVRLNAQDKWPFGFSLLLMPFLALFGGGREAATLLCAAGFALTAPLLVWAGEEAEPGGRGAAAGLLAALLWTAAPLERALATVVYRESVGAALAVAGFAAWLGARRRDTVGAWRTAGLLLLALFFVKSNYFALLAGGLAVAAWIELGAAGRRAALGRARAAVLERGWSSPARWAAIALLLSGLLLASGRNPGGLIYGCLVLGAGFWAVRRWRRRGIARPAPAPGGAVRALVPTLVAPIWVWCLSPDPIHPRNLISFLRNRSGDLPPLSAEALAFYPRAFVSQLAAAPALGVALGLLALAGLALVARRGDPARPLASVAAVGFLATAGHSLKEARFLATVAPFLLLLAALPLARAALAANGSGLRKVTGRILFAGLLGLAASLAWTPTAFARLTGDHLQLTVPRGYARPLAEIVRRVTSAPGTTTGLVGGCNEVAEDLVRWEAWIRGGREARIARSLRGLTGSAPPPEVRARLEEWLGDERPGRLVSFRPLPGGGAFESADYRRWNAWQSTAIRALARDRRWHARHRRKFRRPAFEVATWVPRPPGARGKRGGASLRRSAPVARVSPRVPGPPHP
jgi:hypothetical protein